MAFSDRLKRLDRNIAASDLTVLVWGSGRDSGEAFEKRMKIRQAIEDAFPNADVRFSEDQSLKQDLQDHLSLDTRELEDHEQELWHLGACDVCVVLDTSKGPGEEIAHFTATPFADRLLILTHKQYQGVRSFPASLRKNQNQIFFSDSEYCSCGLVQRVLTRLRQVALGKMLGHF